MDLGTNCGFTFCFYDPSKELNQEPGLLLYHGQIDLSAGAYESGATRFLRFRQFLDDIKPDLLAYELVRNKPAIPSGGFANLGQILARVVTSMEFLGALKATLSMWAEENGVPVVGFGIGEIKKRATSHGNCDKESMVKAANALFGMQLDVENFQTLGHDNVADSAFVSLLAIEQYGASLGNMKGFYVQDDVAFEVPRVEGDEGEAVHRPVPEAPELD